MVQIDGSVPLQRALSDQWNAVDNMVIVCASHAAAGQVIMLLLDEELYPRTHFRIEQTGSIQSPITISLIGMLSADQVARLRAGIATIPGASIP